MSNTAHAPLSEAEREERKLFLQRLAVDFPKPTAKVVPMRRDLGLRPVIEPEDGPRDNIDKDGRAILSDGFSFSFKDDQTAEFLASTINADFLFDCMNALMSTIDVGHEKAKQVGAEARKEITEARATIRMLELEREKDRASLAEMRSKVAELDFVVSRLKVENAGPIGPPGPRGVDGRDGQRGPTGAEGKQGREGPRVVAFETDDSAFVAVELLSNGRKGASLNLRGMFESYHAQVEGEAAAEEADAAAASRRAVDDEVERVRRGLPR